MSGPKLSAAEIAQMRREQLERERLEALKRLTEAKNEYRRVCDKAIDTKKYVMSLLNQIDEIYSDNAKKTLEDVLPMLKIIGVSDEKNPQAYYAAADIISRNMEYVLEKINSDLGKYIERTETDQALTKSDRIHQSFQSFLKMRSDLVDVMSIDFHSDFDNTKLSDNIEKVFAHYKWMGKYSNNDELKRFARKSTDYVQKNIIDKYKGQFLAKESYIIEILQSIINEEADIKRREDEKSSLYEDYSALTTMMDIIPKNPSDFADAQSIGKAIAELKFQLRKKDEMDYIADQINDAMISLGYGFVTSKALIRKDLSEMDFSLYQADEETGIAIYTDQTGAVMMQMTVLGNDTDITDADREFSIQRQIDFCSGHEDIIQALSERGVYLKQKSYLEPDRKHTYKMNTNSSGNTVQRDADGQIILNKNKVDRRKRRRANKKKMRAM